MLRFLVLRFLPRRLLPLLTLYEVYRLFRRFQAARTPRPSRRLVVSGSSTSGAVTTIGPVTTMTPPTVDGQVYGA